MEMKNSLRFTELVVLLYRLLLAYFFYQLVRGLFWFFNRDVIEVEGVGEYLALAYYGVAFDTTAILYINALFIFLSLIPIVINTKKQWQKFLFWLYFITNGIGYCLNFIDFIYYRFSQSRLTSAVVQVTEHEDNISQIFFASIAQHPMVPVWYIVLMLFWAGLYKRVRLHEVLPTPNVKYFLGSIAVLCIVAVLVVGGIRGDFKHSTRPINMVDASKHVRIPAQGNIVLNSAFSLFRTISSNGFKEVHLVESDFIENELKPYKHYHRTVENPPNIVILIVESLGREYSGAFNEKTAIQDYVSYTPFIDSLAKHSLIFPNSFANGRQSIHAMSSILAGIPALKDAFTSSPYANQKIQSVVSIANEMGYDTSFYHGAPNGSMGFQGFANILGYQRYIGKDEYNNDDDFDGIWAIWDEPFLQYFATHSGKKQPFLSTVFTASSHHPFKIPEQYKGKFRKGKVDIHEPIQYTDYAIKRYFETARKQPWFANTIFVITGDHTNQSYYKEYQNAMNNFAVPILFYSPNPTYNLNGVHEKYAQQMDIYPTLVDLMGYQKPFRSWGKSLLTEDDTPHLLVNSDGIILRIVYGNYIYTFDGKEVVGIYDKHDVKLEHNRISTLKNLETQKGIALTKAWYQDYMHRIIHKKL